MWYDEAEAFIVVATFILAVGSWVFARGRLESTPEFQYKTYDTEKVRDAAKRKILIFPLIIVVFGAGLYIGIEATATGSFLLPASELAKLQKQFEIAAGQRQ